MDRLYEKIINVEIHYFKIFCLFVCLFEMKVHRVKNILSNKRKTISNTY